MLEGEEMGGHLRTEENHGEGAEEQDRDKGGEGGSKCITKRKKRQQTINSAKNFC
jgi:hypothetical protein